MSLTPSLTVCAMVELFFLAHSFNNASSSSVNLTVTLLVLGISAFGLPILANCIYLLEQPILIILFDSQQVKDFFTVIFLYINRLGVQNEMTCTTIIIILQNGEYHKNGSTFLLFPIFPTSHSSIIINLFNIKKRTKQLSVPGKGCLVLI